MLNDKMIRSLPPPQKGSRDQYPDGKIHGLSLRVTRRGHKVFTFVYRFKGKQLRLSLGYYPNTSLAQARTKAYTALTLLKQGIDPATSKTLADTAAASPLMTDPSLILATELETTILPPENILTFGEAVDLFLRRHCARKNKPSTAAETKRLLQTHFKAWNQRPLSAITKTDIIGLIDDIVDRGAPSAARHAYTAIRTFFTWCAGRDLVAANPSIGIDKPPAGKPRDRALTAAELKRLCKTARALGYPYGTYLEILLVTGQRRGEVAGMRWSEIDYEQNLWKLPGARTKNRLDNYIPLTPRLHALLRSIPRQTDCDFLFPAQGFTDRPFSSFSDIKQAIDDHAGLSGWRIHDIRRTLSTTMGFLEVPQKIIDKILNHQTLKGARRVYQLYEYLNEKDDALRRWQAHLKKLARSPDQPIAHRKRGRRQYPTMAAA